MSGGGYLCNLIHCNKCDCVLRRAGVSACVKKTTPVLKTVSSIYVNVEQMRQEMIDLVIERGSFTDPDVLLASQRLDEMIAQIQGGYRRRVFAIRQSFQTRMGSMASASNLV